MLNKNLRVLSVVSILMIALVSSFASAEESITQDELLRRTKELFDAAASASNVPWVRYYADDCLFFDEKGRSLDKASLMEDVKQLPTGYRVSFQIEKPQSRIFSDIAIFSYDIVEDLWIYGQHVGATFHTTDTWLLRNNQWQIIASQTHRYYRDPAPGKSDPSKFSEYAGTYELAEGVRVTVSLDGKDLYYQRGDTPKQLLIPEAEGVFFRKGVEGRILFRYGKDNKVDALISRRNHEDLIYKKLTAG